MDTTTTETAARLRRAITRFNRKLRYSALGGVTPAQASMLASIGKLESPSLGELAEAEQIQPPSVTRLVKDMMKAGLISSASDPLDRRSTRVRLTALGRRDLNAIRQRKTEFVERKLLALSPIDQRQAAKLVSFLELLLEDE
ncbi:MAG TPA: MarR family transcriptional regulator [Acidimicrobiales bacterium]|nr:MarR family transcriptional regulator [Acidimicrobiales bacterium]